MEYEEIYANGVRKLLFGEYRPEHLLRRYRKEEGQLFHRLLTKPDIPSAYLKFTPAVNIRWLHAEMNNQTEQWPSDYFHIPDTYPEPGHILSTFYRAYIWCELRMVILALSAKQSDTSVPVEVLRYELITLLESWQDLLIECHERLQLRKAGTHNESFESGKLIEHLQIYLWKRLFVSLEISIYELQIRFPLIPNDRMLTREELYLQQLEQPVPDETPYVQTVARTRMELQHLIHKENAPEQIDSLIADIQSELSVHSDKELRHVLCESMRLLENARLCAGLIQENNKTGLSDILNEKKNGDRISHLIGILQEGRTQSSKEKADLHKVMRSMNEYRVLFATGKSEHDEIQSEAVQLIRMIDNYFTEPHSTAYSQDRTLQISPKHAKENLLDRYVDVDEIRKKIGVHHKTMKKYLGKSGAEVIEFSPQRQLIHEDEVEKFLNYHKKIKQTQ
ncbi:MAG: hypothetical protein U5K72_14475 [Balneolaceae bacterium]|nr:hypothetical protein [Balneolaceae bacterium]